MYKAKDVTNYLLFLDSDNRLFYNTGKMNINGRDITIGNARLNKYLHLAQNVYYAKTGSLLFEDKLYAYDNGGVVKPIQENYFSFINRETKSDTVISNDVKGFLKKFYAVLRSAPLERLIEFSHEDPAWLKKHNGYTLAEQRMDTIENLEDYRERYEDIIEYLDRMQA